MIKPIQLSELLNAVVQDVGSSAFIIDSDLRILACAGDNLKSPEQGADGGGGLAAAHCLGDESLNVDIASALHGDLPAARDFVTHHGHWLRRSLTLLDTTNQLLLINYRDVSNEKIQCFVSQFQKSILNALDHSNPPETIFSILVTELESRSAPGSFASILWLSPNGKHLRHVASSSLPSAYTQAIDIAIRDDANSFSAAVISSQRVIVEDIQTDPLWEDYRDLAVSSGLRACWLQPIVSHSNSVLGVLALYRNAVRSPSKAELDLLDTAAMMAAMVFRNLLNESKINLQASLLDKVHDAVIVIDQDNIVRYWSSGARKIFGYRIDKSHERAINTLIDISAGMEIARNKGNWCGEVYTDPDDETHLCLEITVSTVIHSSINDRGFVVVLRDISKLREAEKMVVAQSQQNHDVAHLENLALGNISCQSLLNHAIEILASTLEIEICVVFELEENRESLVLRAEYGLQTGSVGKFRIASDHTSLIGFTLLSSSAVICEDLNSDQRFVAPEFLQQQKAVSSLSMIIYGHDNKPYGVVGVISREKRIFSESEINFLHTTTNHLSENIQREELNEILQNNEKRFRDLANSMPHIIWSANAQGHIDYFNNRWFKILGVREMTCHTDAWLNALHPSDRCKWLDGWDISLKTHASFEVEIRIQGDLPDCYRWYLARALPAFSDDGNVSRWYGSCTDINEQKCIEHRLREKTHELEMISWINTRLATELDLEQLVQVVIDVGTKLSGARFGVYLHSADGVADNTDSVYAFSGVSRETFKSLQIPSAKVLFKPLLDGDGVMRSDDILTDSRYGTPPPHIRHPPGYPPIRSYMAVPVVSRSGDIIGGMFFGHPKVGVFDANDERLIRGLAIQAAIAVNNARIYHELIDSKNEARGQYEQLNAIYATAPVGLCYLDSKLQVVSINDHLRNLVDCTINDVRNMRLTEVLGNAAAPLEELCQEVLQNPMPLLNREIKWPRESSEKDSFWLCNCYPILTSEGTVRGINTVIQDISERKQGELDIARLASIVSNSYDAIISKTLDGIITSWNHGAERMFGFKGDSVIGQPISIIIPDDMLQEEQEVQIALRQGRHITIDESKRIRKDGVIIHVALTISPIINGVNEIIGVSTIIRDITASKAAEQKARENEDRMRLILQATKIGTWDWRINTETVRWSPNMEELHGRLPGSFDGTLNSVMSDIYPDDKNILQKAISHTLQSDGNYHVEYRILTESKEIRWIEDKGQVLYGLDGKPERLAGVCMDITERKEAEQALRINETILRSQAEELAREHQQKDEFLAMLAHELRNPLAPISNMVQLMKIQAPDQRDKTLPHALDIIGRQVTQIARLVDDLLDVARITRGFIELKSEKQDIRAIVSQAVDTASVWFEAKLQKFELNVTDEPVFVHADETRLIQVISNLLNNASKYTAKSGDIRLSLESVGQEAIISIADNGIGISSDLLPHVFDLFTQADRSLDRRQGGLGLGLPLVKKLIKLHHGTVIARSPGVGRGSEFIIRLPLAEVLVDKPIDICSTNANVIQEENQMRIMVVDDNVHSADAMVMLLETLGHSVEVAYSGLDALSLADTFVPDLVLLDIGLPLMDGYEIAAKLRARFGNHVTLVALTGYSKQHGNQGAKNIDFDEYLLKPLSLDYLISLLAKHTPTNTSA